MNFIVIESHRLSRIVFVFETDKRIEQIIKWNLNNWKQTTIRNICVTNITTTNNMATLGKPPSKCPHPLAKKWILVLYLAATIGCLSADGLNASSERGMYWCQPFIRETIAFFGYFWNFSWSFILNIAGCIVWCVYYDKVDCVFRSWPKYSVYIEMLLSSW